MSKDLAEEYATALADLQMNSKPLINMLTMLAEDYITVAPNIVKKIEARLHQVRPESKLPILYLIDSIVKNVAKEYRSLFLQNIVSSFCSVFEVADEKIRIQMYKLRSTWNDIFPPKKLYALDIRINVLDPNWPVSTPVPPSIHINPKFLNSNTPGGTATGKSSVSQTPQDANKKKEQHKMLKKQKELLEIQKKQVEIELLQTKAIMEEQQKKLEASLLQTKQEKTIKQKPKIIEENKKKRKKKQEKAEKPIEKVEETPPKVQKLDLDSLFGKEDVDLRTWLPEQAQKHKLPKQTPIQPPPPNITDMDLRTIISDQPPTPPPPPIIGNLQQQTELNNRDNIQNNKSKTAKSHSFSSRLESSPRKRKLPSPSNIYSQNSTDSISSVDKNDVKKLEDQSFIKTTGSSRKLQPPPVLNSIIHDLTLDDNSMSLEDKLMLLNSDNLHRPISPNNNEISEKFSSNSTMTLEPDKGLDNLRQNIVIENVVHNSHKNVIITELPKPSQSSEDRILPSPPNIMNLPASNNFMIPPPPILSMLNQTSVSPEISNDLQNPTLSNPSSSVPVSMSLLSLPGVKVKDIPVSTQANINRNQSPPVIQSNIGNISQPIMEPPVFFSNLPVTQANKNILATNTQSSTIMQSEPVITSNIVPQINNKINNVSKMDTDPSSSPKTSSENVDESESGSALDVVQLLQKLVATGMVPNKENNTTQQDKTVNYQVDFSQPKTLKKRQPELIAKLYSGIQCNSCGIRFPPEENTKYSQHLDWHFRENRKEKDSSQFLVCQKWYYPISGWIQVREASWNESQSTTIFNQENKETEKNEEVEKEEISVRAAPNETNVHCPVCHDRFDQFYDQDKEEWRFRKAIRANDQVFHPLCYDDYQESLNKNNEIVSNTSTNINTDIEVVEEVINDVEDVEEIVEVDTEVVGESEKPNQSTDDDDILHMEVIERKIETVELTDSEAENDDDDEDNEEKENKINKLETKDIDKEDNNSTVCISDNELDDTIENGLDLKITIKQEKQDDLQYRPTSPNIMTNTIDGNVEFRKVERFVAPSVKLNLTRIQPINNKTNHETQSNDDSSDNPETPPDVNLIAEENEVIEPLKPKHIKEIISEANLQIREPFYENRRELSGLCSIM